MPTEQGWTCGDCKVPLVFTRSARLDLVVSRAYDCIRREVRCPFCDVSIYTKVTRSRIDDAAWELRRRRASISWLQKERMGDV